jgi:hypothetical protein
MDVIVPLNDLATFINYMEAWTSVLTPTGAADDRRNQSDIATLSAETWHHVRAAFDDATVALVYNPRYSVHFLRHRHTGQYACFISTIIELSSFQLLLPFLHSILSANDRTATAPTPATSAFVPSYYFQ